jgi:4-hydroxy-tetrahydrodipicolinate reductase
LKVAIVGYGRMGQEIEAAADARGHAVVRVVDPSERGRRVRRTIDPQDLRGIEAAFEFTGPESAEANVIALLQAGVPVVCGTTGWDSSSSTLRKAVRASKAGAVIAPNFSVGMNLFHEVVRDAARRFGATDQYDPYVVEAHHRGKADAPSGTARWLGEVVVDEDPRRWTLQIGNMPPGTVHLVSIRAGHEQGTHTVGFDGENEVVTLTHRTRGRAGFAAGAVLAAEWLQGRRGLHGFERVLADVYPRGGRR